MVDFIARVATGAVPTGTGNFNIGGSSLLGGETPKAALIFVCNDTDNSLTNVTAHAVISIGWCIGSGATQEITQSQSSEDNKASTDTFTLVSGTDTMLMVDENAGGTKDSKFAASFVSFSADTLTLNVSENEDSAAYRYMAILFGGDGCSVSMTHEDTHAGLEDATKDYTHNLGNDSQLHFTMVNEGSGANNMNTNLGIVHWDGTTITQRFYQRLTQDNLTVASLRSKLFTNRCATQSSGVSFGSTLEATAATDDVLTLTKRDGSGVSTLNMLHVSLGNSAGKLITLDGPASGGGTDWAVTSIGFTSQLIGLICTQHPTVDTEVTNQDADGVAFGAFDEDGNEQSIGIAEDDAAETTNTNSYAAAAFADLWDYFSGTSSQYLSADNPVIDSDGFDVANADIHVADNSDKLICWAIEENIEGGAGILRPPLKPFRHNLLR
jgi:hypothetical protein